MTKPLIIQHELLSKYTLRPSRVICMLAGKVLFTNRNHRKHQVIRLQEQSQRNSKCSDCTDDPARASQTLSLPQKRHRVRVVGRRAVMRREVGIRNLVASWWQYAGGNRVKRARPADWGGSSSAGSRGKRSNGARSRGG